MILRPSTYEFADGAEPRWVVAHQPAHAQAYAEAQGWTADSPRVAYGPFLTALLVSELDADAILDAQGDARALPTLGACP